MLLTKHLSVSTLFRDFRLKSDFPKRHLGTSYERVASREVQGVLVGAHPGSFEFLKLRKSRFLSTSASSVRQSTGVGPDPENVGYY